MQAWLDRARVSLARTRRALAAIPKPTAVHAADKLAAISSYARFCDGGEPPAWPLEMFLEISNLCDLKCAMCVQFSALNADRFKMLKATDRGFFKAEEITENLRHGLSHALLVHCFGYGEPTLHPEFRSLLDFLSGFEVLIDFFTNGMHLDSELCKFLVDRKIYQITVSFSGATKALYENIYLGGDFDRVLGGIRRLADAKAARGSRYPIIEINSLAFVDHVAGFEAFVELMARHGANVVHLKPLQHHKVVPQLYEHVSIARPGHEDEIVRSAVATGARLGVEVSADLYLAKGASDEGDYARRAEAMRAAADQHRKPADRPFGASPIADFKTIAGEVPKVRERTEKARTRPVLALGAEADEVRLALDVRTPAGRGQSPAFHCMEPFKTLYVTRNGEAKSCCFANPAAPYLGSLKTDDLLDVWRGAGFAAVREAIAAGDYPMKTCETCLRNRSGPQGHFTAHIIGRYLDWQAAGGARPVRAALAAAALRMIAESTPAEIMARRDRMAKAVVRRTAPAA